MARADEEAGAGEPEGRRRRSVQDHPWGAIVGGLAAFTKGPAIRRRVAARCGESRATVFHPRADRLAQIIISNIARAHEDGIVCLFLL
eukprot:7575853-Alexandrium_andersonii.AAC.1